MGVVALAIASCGEPQAHPTLTARPQAGTTAARTAPARGTALAALDRLPVKGRAPKTGYSREQFGDGWATVRGCDVRDRILGRDLTHRTHQPGDRCAMQSGRLADPYTAAALTYTRGGGSEVDIDHVVALSDAWQKGAAQWSPGKRLAFANDPVNLLAVDAGANRSKGDGDAATWLPPNKGFRCAYVARQVAVKSKYRVWVTRAERDAIARVLARCPGQRLPRSGPQPRRGGRAFANCDAVRAAGRAPLRRRSADYAANRTLDRDHDGLACE